MKICKNRIRGMQEKLLSYDVTSGSDIEPRNKIEKPLVAYRFTGNVMQ